MLQTALTRLVKPADLPAISRLHALAFGPGRFTRTAYRVREGKGMQSRFCRVAFLEGEMVAALRLTEVLIGGRPGAALLGPLAVHTNYRGQGFGRQLVREALEEMREAGVKLVILVGDEPYYGRLGFVPVPLGQITLPGPVNPARILAAELEAGALQSFDGPVTAMIGSETGSVDANNG